MRSHKFLQVLVLIPVLVGILGCKVLNRALDPVQAPTQQPIQLDLSSPTPEASVTSTATDTPEPTRTPKPTRTPAPTVTRRPFQPSATPTAGTPTLTPTPMGQELQLRVFEDLWKTINDNYLYPDFNGVDWKATHDEYKKKIEAGLSNDEFYMAMKEMVYSLKDDHSNYLSPDEVKAQDLEFKGKTKYVGIGIITTAVPERKRATILLVYPGSPAANAGLKAHESIISVDNQPILDSDGHVQNEKIRGPAGTKVTLTIQAADGPSRNVTLTRSAINAMTPVPYDVIQTPDGKRIGYIFLITVADSTITKQVGDALTMMSKAGKLDGLILDNRYNSGGVSTVVTGVLSYFTNGEVGSYVNRQETIPFNVPRKDINGSQSIPMVVLVGKGSVSFGEISSGILQDLGRAFVIGETSDGNVEIEYGYDFEDGSKAWIAHDRFQPKNHPDANWEETGIVPDETVLSNWDQVTLDTDPVIKASVAHILKAKP